MSVIQDPLETAVRRPVRGCGPVHDGGHPDAELTEGLRPLVLQLARQLRRAAQKTGVSSVDAQFLAILARHPGIGVSELADLEQMSRPAMSVHLKRLQSLSLVQHAPAPETVDRRRVRLILTEAGRATLAAVRRSRDDWLVERLAALPREDKAALAAALAPLRRLLVAKPVAK